jgi:hypothetical protein
MRLAPAPAAKIVVAEEDKVVAEEDKVVAEEDKVVAEEDKVVAEEDKVVAVGSSYQHSTYITMII